MFEADDRLHSIASVDKTRAALVDATSLRSLAQVLECDEIPTSDLERWFRFPEGMTLANVIQTFVLHETVYADSILFDRYDDIDKFDRLLPGGSPPTFYSSER